MNRMPYQVVTSSLIYVVKSDVDIMLYWQKKAGKSYRYSIDTDALEIHLTGLFNL